jgi:hypothetical protein
MYYICFCNKFVKAETIITINRTYQNLNYHGGECCYLMGCEGVGSLSERYSTKFPSNCPSTFRIKDGSSLSSHETSVPSYHNIRRQIWQGCNLETHLSVRKS